MPKHLQVFVTRVLLESTSRQRVVPFSAIDDRCILESDMISHLVLDSLHIKPSLAGFPSPFDCKQKYVPFRYKIFWGVYFHGSVSVQGPNLSGSKNDFLRTQRPVNGWKITLCRVLSDKPGPAGQKYKQRFMNNNHQGILLSWCFH